MKRKLQKKAGFTLIEVLISLVVFAIIIIPISMMVMQGVKTNKKAEKKQQAMLIVQNIMESIKAFSEDELNRDLKLEIRGKEIKIEGKKIKGDIEGYEIEGNIKPEDGYKFLNTSMKYDDGYEVNADKKNKIIISKGQDEKITIDGIHMEEIQLKNKIYIISNETESKEVTVEITNDSTKESSIYLMKKESSKVKYVINNKKGVFNIVSDIVIPNNKYSQDIRLFEIYVKASKGETIFEATSYKNIK